MTRWLARLFWYSTLVNRIVCGWKRHPGGMVSMETPHWRVVCHDCGWESRGVQVPVIDGPLPGRWPIRREARAAHNETGFDRPL